MLPASGKRVVVGVEAHTLCNFDNELCRVKASHCPKVRFRKRVVDAGTGFDVGDFYCFHVQS